MPTIERWVAVRERVGCLSPIAFVLRRRPFRASPGVSPHPTAREDGLTHPADTSISNLAAALALVADPAWP
jgi:hypothetical protein